MSSDSIARRLSETHVLVIGDAMLDEYVIGEATRISPEAPVPVIDVAKRNYNAGGSANVASNVSGLGAVASIIALVGSDAAGETLTKLMQSAGIATEGLVRPEDRATITKTRIVAGQQQIVRFDQETRTPLSDDWYAQVLAQASRLIERTDICVLSDYGKGLLHPKLCQQIIALARERCKPVIVDPKGRNFDKYRGCTAITPNLKETSVAAGIEVDSEEDLETAAAILLRNLPGTTLVITRGAQGMSVFREGSKPMTVPTVARTVFDVVGAGDTAVATLAVAMAARVQLETAIRLANIAAGIVVQKHGTVAITAEELILHEETRNLLRRDGAEQARAASVGATALV
jgi:rfaE bifunctional protein kinase chain/domain